MMADFKRRTLTLSSGRQIKLYGNSMAIANTYEIGEGAAPNIFAFLQQGPEEKQTSEVVTNPVEGKPPKENTGKKATATVLNPHRLTAEEIQEVADYNIQLWMNLKAKLRQYKMNDPRLFNSEALR